MEAFIEQIEAGLEEKKLWFIKLRRTPDRLDLSNKPSWWILDLFRGYKQLGRFPVDRPHEFREREWVEVDIKDNEVVAVRKLTK